MSKRRVAITGVGLVTPIGHSLDAVSAALREGRHGIVSWPEWATEGKLTTLLAAPVRDIDVSTLPRKKTRTMGRVSILSALASDQAVKDAGLTPELLSSGEVGLAYGSTHGSSSELTDFCARFFKNGRSLIGTPPTSYLKFMSHTTAANLATYYGIRGRVISTCAACVSASLAVGAGYEAIQAGIHDVLICGGAEELHFSHAGVFDILFAASHKYNDRPDRSPRAFDAARDGLVVGEGAGTLVLEALDRAQARGAKIHGEVVGYGTNCDGGHLTDPSSDGMARVMKLALRDAGLDAAAIDYVNAHGTATAQGDIAESRASYEVFGDRVPLSSTKGFTGHTLGACGAIEVAFCLAMMRDRFLAPNRNLDEVDPQCAPLNYVRGEARRAEPATVMSNNFAFGGINTSLILRRY
ncbi:MAG: beta-ketoacyl-ACP synthase [Myxococcales bacterium]